MIKYFVFDTNNLISASLLVDSTNKKAERKAVVVSHEERLELLNELESSIEQFFPSEVITACRDPKDNKFLELAIAANASCIITGDKDLLILNPFRNIPILNAVDFLKNF